MDRAHSKFVGNTVNFQAWPGEVQQQAKVQSGRLQMIYALRGVRRVQRLAGFQFNGDRVLNREIGNIFPAG